MEKHQQQQQQQQPVLSRRHNANVVNGAVSNQNSHGIRGTQQSPDAEISENSVQQPQYGSNADDVAPNSPLISAENFHTDSPADMINIIDQIMGRVQPPSFHFTDNASGFPADSSYTSMNNNMPPNGNNHGLSDNQTQTAPLYNAATSNGNSASLSSNYFFPVNDMMQQSSMYGSSNHQTNWQGSSPGNQYGQSSVISPTLFSTQSYNSFQTNASTASIRPGTSSLPVGTISPGTYNSYSLPLSGSNARQVASFGNSRRRTTFGPGMSSRIELGFNTFTSSEPQSSPSVSSTSGGSTREMRRQDSSGTHALSATSQQGSFSSSSRQENYLHQTLPLEGPTSFNRVYDPRYAELGLPVDPYLRMFNQNPEFWKNVHGNGDLQKK